MRRTFLAIVLALLATLAGAETLQVSIPPTQVVDDPAGIQVYVDDLDSPPFIQPGADGQSVTVTIGGVSGSLTKGSTSRPNTKPPCCWPIWLGSIDLSSLASGDYPIVATATNSTGQTFTASGTVTLDRRPAITVQQPAWAAVTGRHMAVDATCTDDYGCTSLILRLAYNYGPARSGVDRIQDTVDVSAASEYPEFSATDTRGQVTTRQLRIFLEDSPHLRAVVTVPGEMLDADATRILWQDPGGQLWIRDRGTGANTFVHPRTSPYAVFIRNASLTPAGAIFQVEEDGSPPQYLVKSFENGTLVVLSTQFGCCLSSNGRYAVFHALGNKLLWRDTVAGETRELTASSAGLAFDGLGLSPGGAVAFWQGPSAGPWELVLYDPQANPALRTVYPQTSCQPSLATRTDGSTVVFRVCGNVYAWKDGVQRSLVPATLDNTTTFDVAGGWIGVAVGTAVWRFDPQGLSSSITPPYTGPAYAIPGWFMERAGADGTVVFRGAGRFGGFPGDSVPRQVGSNGGGRVVFIGGVLHVVLGNSLLVYDRAVPKVSPWYHDFGTGAMGMRTPPRTVTLTNDSNAAVTITGVSTTAGYVQTHDCAGLSPGQSCAVQVAFAPPATAVALNASVDVLGTLSITSSGASQPIRVALTGLAQKSLVAHFYQSIIGRTPDAGGNAFWQGEASRVFSLGADLNEAWYAMAMAFFASAEYNATPRTNAAYVTDLYETFFSRTPDSGGLAYWAGQLDAGLPREVALAAFMFSPEFAQLSRAIFGGGPARAEIDMVMDFYRGLLGRLPDTAGFNHWVQQFRAAQCQGESAVRAQVEAISSAFAGSSEYAARNRTNPAYVGDMYNAFLRRGGDLDGVRFWLDQLNAGRSREQLRRDFVASTEFSARVQAVVAQGCVQ